MSSECVEGLDKSTHLEMMLDLSSDGEPTVMWTTDRNDAGPEQMTLSLGRVQLTIAQPGAASVSGIGTGALVWQAGPVLATTLMNSGGGCLRDCLLGRVIELGCGCSALPGVAAALCGSPETVVTDSSDVLAELQNNLAGYRSSITASAADGTSRIEVVSQPLDWADTAALAELATGRRGFSLVLAADCDYADSLHGALIDTVSAALGPQVSNAALFASAVRCERTLHLFLTHLSKRNFDVTELNSSLEVMPPDVVERVQHQDGVRFFAAQWRSEAHAIAERARLVAAASDVAQSLGVLEGQTSF